MRPFLAIVTAAAVCLPLLADDPRPTPATRPEMKKLIEDMKDRKPRIPLPELTDADKEKLGDRANSYEARLRYHYMGGEVPRQGGAPGGSGAFGFGGSGTLDGKFKTQLFWIVCRTNNCQYCQGHQESKLLRDGMTEDEIAALDFDWEKFTPAQQAAFAFARKFTFEPHKLTDADIDALRKHYKDAEILEMVLSMAGNNAINRWKEGTGVPQSPNGGGFGRGEQPAEKHTYLTPTADKYKDAESKVAVLNKDDQGKPTGKTGFSRPPLESKEETEKALAAAAKRKERLPLVEEDKAREVLPGWGKGSLPKWVRLLANDLGKARVAAQLQADEKGDLKPLLKAQVSWIIARHDRAWYAVGRAKKSLLGLGQTEDQIYALDGDWKGFTAGERSEFTLVKKLAASPVVLTDEDVATAVKEVGPRDVTQLINYVTVCASFDRITEAAGLPVETDDTTAPPKGEKTAKPLKLPDGVKIESLSDPKEAAKVADQLEKEYPEPRGEAARMLIAILRGSQLGGNDGWFGPAESRYSYKWLAERSKLDAKAEGITKEQFAGTADQFKQLDRDGDGKITAADLDWSPRNPYVMQASMVNGLFRRMDQSGDGKVTKDELEMMFKYLAKDRDYFTADDFRRAMIPRGGGGFSPGDEPSIPVLVKGLFGNEIGSMSEGPKVDDTAPDFTLKTPDGKDTVQLSKLTGTKPVVLVFGNFTCGPFRSLFPDVEAVAKRHKDEATFVMVYVREAHPTDGWKMEQNTKMGVSAKQPTTYAERVEVCEQFKKLLKPGLTLAVDDITDPAGTAYSGMPARLYVIDPKGKVAYKSGRGPFGFKPGEMEQALVMCLSESTPVAKPEPK